MQHYIPDRIITLTSGRHTNCRFSIYNTCIQGGPERMQHLRSLISKKSDTKSNKCSCINVKTFFFQQNDTKIKDFDKGVLILEQFF